MEGLNSLKDAMDHNHLEGPCHRRFTNFHFYYIQDVAHYSSVWHLSNSSTDVHLSVPFDYHQLDTLAAKSLLNRGIFNAKAESAPSLGQSK